MKTLNAPLPAALAVLVVLVAAAVACGSGRVPEKKASFIAQCRWTLDDYAGKADALIAQAQTMESPLREDAQYRAYLVIEKAAEGRAKLDELKTATGARERELTAEITAIIKEVKARYEEAEKAVGR